MHRGDDVHQKNGDHNTMTEPVQAVHAYAQAVAALTPETRATLDPFLADDVVVAGPISPGSGRTEVLEALGAPNASRLLGSAEWGEPIFDGETARLEAVVPPGSPVRGMVFTLAFDASGRITRVDQQILAAPPPPVTELALTPEIVAAVNGALANATPVIVAYVDASGIPHLSLRGSTQAFGDQQLAIWIRDPQGGLLAAIEDNPASRCGTGTLRRGPTTSSPAAHVSRTIRRCATSCTTTHPSPSGTSIPDDSASRCWSTWTRWRERGRADASGWPGRSEPPRSTPGGALRLWRHLRTDLSSCHQVVSSGPVIGQPARGRLTTAGRSQAPEQTWHRRRYRSSRTTRPDAVGAG